MGKKDSIATVERGVPDVLEELPAGGGAPWNMGAVDPVAELAKFEAAAELQSKLLPASIKRTLPEDWLDQGGKAYLQATGIERLAPLWGIVFGKYTVEREEHTDGSYAYIVRGWVYSRRTGVFYSGIVGGRSSADPFFDDFDEDKPPDWSRLTPGERATWKRAHRIPPDPLEVHKAAVTNWSTRGASMLMGMRGLTVAYLEGLGMRGIRRVEYGTGAKGGSTTPADLKARRTALWNEILRRTRGELAVAKELLREVTKYDAYTAKKTGKKVAAFAGASSTDSLSEYALQVAETKVAEHKIFGDAAEASEPAGPPEPETREPGDET